MRSGLKMCDVGILPTRQDVFLDLSFSSKLSEYIIMGKPVIASRLKTIRYYFSEEALAYFEPHNISDLARQMFDLYREPSRRVQLATKPINEYRPIRCAECNHRNIKL